MFCLIHNFWTVQGSRTAKTSDRNTKNTQKPRRTGSYTLYTGSRYTRKWFGSVCFMSTISYPMIGPHTHYYITIIYMGWGFQSESELFLGGM